MTGHIDACGGSAALCDALFEGLRKSIPDLKRERTPGDTKCRFCEGKKAVFAYVTHQKTADAITIWCRGDIAKLQNLIGRTVQPIGGASGSWDTFTGRFKVAGPSQIAAAVRGLVECSYPASTERRQHTKRPPRLSANNVSDLF